MRKFGSRNFIAFLAALLLLVSVAGCTVAPDPGVEVEPTIVTLSKTELSIDVGETALLTAEVSDDHDVIWSSQSEKIATVSGGVVTGVSAGTTTITAVAGNGYATCKVTVYAEEIESEFFLPLTSARLQIGDQITLDAAAAQGDVVWASTSDAIASVENGVVTGISAGVARITAMTEFGDTAECIITVSEEPTSALKLSKSIASVKEGEGMLLLAQASNNAAVTWLSEDPAVATVKDGVVSGVTVGTTYIYAWTTYASAMCRVTVRDENDPYKDGYTLVWNDEFEGDSLDLDKWDYMLGVQDVYGSSTGPWFWGNNELQYYTKEAVTLRNGSLIITAKRENKDYDRTYTSARIHTRDKGYWTYGYFEARMQTPALKGMWPAFWMLPQPSSNKNTNNEYGGWAANGEIDIMEAKGRLGNYVDTTLHFGNQGSSTMKGTSTALSSSTENWHIYALEWCEDHMSWFIDGIEVLRVESSEWWSQNAPNSVTAPFDVDFYILLDLAVGGTYDQNRAPDDDFISAEMRVDYVRVYQSTASF